MADLSMHLAETDVPTSRSDDGTTSEQSLSNNYEPIIFRQIVPNRLFLSTDVSGPNSLLQPLNLVGFENYAGFIGGGQTPAFPLDFSSNFNNSTHAQMVARNSAKTLKCPKCNWNYKYQDTLESHMREKHPDIEITCVYCLQNRPHPKLARGETYSCGYKPYRCELCGYSTTTKGNLSIHMQSDKHLHAMQEMPNSMIVSSPIHPTEVGDEKSLHCMICTNFSTNNADDMVDHLENDRSRTCPNDITFSHGTYQCRLCPYNTNLKANFQLHMRTDKHIQRVQLVNHMREGSSTAGIAPGALVCRLSAVKSLIQVRCRPCQEVLTCTKAIREHCESRTHQSRIAFMQVNATNISRQSSTTPSEINTTQTEFDLCYECKFCGYETNDKMNAIDHCHEHTLSSIESCSQNIKIQPDESDEYIDISAITDENLLNMNEAAYCCSKCDFFAKTAAELQAHEESGEHVQKSEAIEESCPLCPQKSSTLRAHLLEDHKISEIVIDKLMVSTVATTSEGTDNTALNCSKSNIYRYRCSQCAMAFKMEGNLQAHMISHTFKTAHKCSKCSKSFRNIGALKRHISEEHGVNTDEGSCDSENGEILKCEICKESFAEKSELQTHLNSVEHLHNAKKFLEDQGNNLQLSEQVLALLQQPQSRSPATTSSTSNLSLDKKPFRCNVCKLGYGQGSSLDIHLRSVAHQSRMARLAELVVSGEVNPSKPVSEQPGITWAPQKTIGEMVKTLEVSGEESQAGQVETPSPMDATVHQMAALNNMFNMAQLFSLAQQSNAATSPVPTFSTGFPGISNLGQLPLNGNFDFNQHLNALFGNATTSDKPTFSTSTHSISRDDSVQTPKTGVAFRKALEEYGFVLVKQYIENLSSQKRKFEKIPEDVIPDMASVDCQHCQRTFANIWALKSHCDETHNGDVPEESIHQFSEKLRKVLDDIEDEDVKPNLKRSLPKTPLKSQDVEDSPPESKRIKAEDGGTRSGRSSTGVSTPKNTGTKKSEPPAADLTSQLTMMSMMTAAGFPFLASANPFMSMMTPEMVQTMAASMSSLIPGSASTSTALSMPNIPTSVTPTGFGSCSGGSPQKRARTRITDEQLKILRQYFDINNSPSEQQIKEMSVKAQLPEKVIKHWFRNTLFKERQRDKDSPYNFNVPPQMSIDLDTYEKTGEARILPLKNEDEDTKQENTDIQNDNTFASMKSPSTTPETSQPQSNALEIESISTSTGTTASSAVADFMANLNKAAAAAAMSGMTNYAACMNPFASFMADDKTLTSMLSGMNSASAPPLGAAQALATSSGNSGSMTGRRANRTRFTDFQLRTLQQFFDKQAYPKDDDLEMLSKKLNLSPRVIVVWFQNARQKARKIYENQPNQDNNERFVRTPGCNFQCKRCSLVFQRYYELIQHQQKVCYINDDEGQQTDNKSVEENLDDEEKYIEQDSNAAEPSMEALATPTTNKNNEFNIEMALAQLTNGTVSNDGSNPDVKSDDLFKLIASSKASSEAMLKMLKNRERKRNFYKRCPFCGLLFHLREKLSEHIQCRHKDQPLAMQIDLELLPDAEDVPTITTQTNDTETNGHTDFSPLDLSCSGDQQQPFSPTISHSDNGEDGSGEDFYFRPTSSSPLSNLLHTSGSNAGSISSQRSPAQNSKRYRTHLTPLQVYVMKSLFNDYKTPSMTECDILGSHIGLNKRVVQVWFQNARAKERKARASSSADEDQPKNTSTSCSICNVEFNSRTTLQDHIFTVGHIAHIKDRAGVQIRGNENDSPHASAETIPLEENKQRAKAVRDTKKPSATINGSLNSGNGRSGLTSPALGATGMNQLSYNLMYGLTSAASLPMICDPNVIGTPIPALQIPQSVMQRIAIELSQGKPSTKFTQDGHELQELASKVHTDDFRCVKTTETEVGWACTQCTNVFQQEGFLKNHQKLICQNCDGIFKLIQIHYECVPCNIKFGTQDEYRNHCDTLPHKTARTLLNPVATSIFA